jgi:xanthine phosphoribosyltransferase
MSETMYLSDNDIKTFVHNIIRQMAKDEFRPDYIVGLTRGGLVPAVMISHYLEVPMETLKVSLRDGEGVQESNLWMAEDALLRKNILIVDDINDTGATINHILTDWPSGCLPDSPDWNYVWNNNVKFAVLVNNITSLSTVNYFGTEINKTEKDIWVTFPWEEFWKINSK